MTPDKPYDYRNCESLFGYSAGTHTRSGGICALCGGGGRRLDFDFWRQLTVEHLVGRSQGGYSDDIEMLVIEYFPALNVTDAKDFVLKIDALNTVTACHFCNATTNHMQAPESMREIIESGGGDGVRTLDNVQKACEQILRTKRSSVEWKLKSVREAHDSQIKPNLEATRLMISRSIAKSRPA